MNTQTEHDNGLWWTRFHSYKRGPWGSEAAALAAWDIMEAAVRAMRKPPDNHIIRAQLLANPLLDGKVEPRFETARVGGNPFCSQHPMTTRCV